MQGNSLRKKKRLVWTAIGIAILPYIVIFILERRTEYQAHFTPTYEKIDISPILKKDSLTEEDYSTLFQQSGLGKYAIDVFRNQPNPLENILPFQESFFQSVNYRCERIGITTKQEYLINGDGEYHYGFPFAPMENGFVLVTKGAHTFGWRNGHIGIVVDSENAISLESITLGVNSDFIDVNTWRTYPTFILLRLKDAESDKLSQIAKTASQYLYDVPYRLTPGIFTKKYADLRSITGTHCSHLVWEAFRYYGYDVDSDGGRIVTVKDIANSPLFEVVQVYGVDPDNPWK